MAATTFDTLTYAKKLQEAGFTAQQAEAQAEALRAVVDENLATKRDLKDLEAALRTDLKEMETALRTDLKEMEAALRSDLKELETRLLHEIELVRRDVLIKLGGIVVAGFTVTAALIGVVIAMLAF